MSDNDLRFYISMFWWRLPYLVLSVLLGAALGIGGALLVKPSFQATARLLIESPPIPAQLARTTVTSTAAEQLQIVREKIITRASLLNLADRFSIYEGIVPPPRPADIVDDLRTRIGFEQIVLDSEGSGASIISISFVADSPGLASIVANDLAFFVLNTSDRARIGSATETMLFFEKERRRLESELASVEADILDFKNANHDSLPESIEFRRSQQATLQERILLLEREQSALQSQRINLGRFGDSGARTNPSAPFSPEQQLLLDLNRALAEQLTVFSEESPAIVALKKRIAAMQTALRRAAENTEKTFDDVSILSPGTESGLAEIDIRLKVIRKERASIAAQLEDLAVSIAKTPTSEKTLNALTRDRDNLQIQYNAAVTKLGEASVGEQIEIDAKRISVVESASPPTRSVGPRRRTIAALGVLAGGGAGLALILLAELLNGTIRRPSEISQLLQSPLLGTIPIIDPPKRRFWTKPLSLRMVT